MSIRKIISGLVLGLLSFTIVYAGGTVLFPIGGGTGTSTAPTYGQLLSGNKIGTYDLIASTSLPYQTILWQQVAGLLSPSDATIPYYFASTSLSYTGSSAFNIISASGTNIHLTPGTNASLYNDSTNFYFQDLGTKISKPASNAMALSVNGYELIRLDPNLDMGLGTTTPNAKLDIYGNDLHPTVDLFGVSSSSNVKLFKIDANGSTTISNLIAGFVKSTSAGSLYTDTTSYQPVLTNPVTGTGVLGFVSRWTSTSAIGQGKFIDDGTVTGINATSSTINFNLQATATFDPFNIASSSGNTQFIVKQSGNTGIGTSTPAAKLEVYGTAGNNPIVNFASSTNSSALYITAASLVGLGITTPATTLDVNGTFNVGIPGTVFSATGGTITTSGSYTIHTFNSSGTFTPNTNGTVDILVVGGGGQGGGAGGGGGGAGGYNYQTNVSVSAQGYAITVGAGGTGGSSAQFGHGNTGATSSFSNLVVGAGGGGGGNNESDGQPGGSGGGGGSAGGGNHPGGAAQSGQGNTGGHDDAVSPFGTGGGGGASAVGADASGGVAGKGGDGTANSITGASVTYAGGGGGATYFSGTAGAGGAGGGGAGSGSGVGTAGTDGLGGGGGGSNGPIGTYVGGVGGKGVVIVRYLTGTVTGTVNSIRATATGNVGIGTTTPSSTFDIYGLSGSSDIFGVSSSSFSRLFTIKSTGNVGIGTSTPSTPLYVIGSTTISNLISGFVKSTATGGLYNDTNTYLNIASIATGTTGNNFNISTTSNILTINCPDASGTNRGCLTSTDWTTFNNKQNALTNPVTGTGVKGYDANWTSTSAIGQGKLIDDGTVLGVNASSSSYTFNLQGNSGTNPFNVASSTKTSVFSIDNLGNTTVGSTTPPAYINFDITNYATGTFPTVTAHLGTSTDGGYIQSITAGDISLNGGVYFNATTSQWIPTNTSASILQATAGTVLFQGDTSLTKGTAYTPTTRMKILANGNVGIGTTTPYSEFAIEGLSGSATNLFSIATSTHAPFLTFTPTGLMGLGTTTPLTRLDVYGLSGNNGIANFASSSNTILDKIDVNGDFTTQHLIGGSAAPTIATSTGVGTGAGTTVSISGSDGAGIVNVKTGTAPSLNATIVTITFNRTYGSAPFCQLTNATSSNPTSTPWATSTASTLLIKSNAATALSATTNYAWYYSCQQ